MSTRARALPFELIAVLAVGLPLALYCTWESLTFVHQPFPGFMVLDTALVPGLDRPSWSGQGLGIRHSVVVEVDGSPIARGGDVYRRVAASPVGTEFIYLLRRDGEERRLALPSRHLDVSEYASNYGPVLVRCWGCLIVAIVLLGLRSDRPEARLFGLFGTLSSASAGLSIALLHALPELTLPWAICTYATPGAMLHAALSFPVERRVLQRSRWLPVALYAPGFLLLVWLIIGVYHEPPDLRPIYIAYVFFPLAASAVLLSLLVTYRQAGGAVRARLKALLPALIIGVAAIVVGELFVVASQRRATFEFTALLVPMCLGAAAYAIIKQDLSNIDRLIRQTFIYSAMIVVAMGLYAGGSEVALWLRGQAGSQEQALLSTIFVATLAVALHPVRRLAQDWIDQTFYRERLDYRDTVERLSEEMTGYLDPEIIIERLTAALTETVHLRSVAVLLFPGERGGPAAWRRRVDSELRTESVPAEAEALRTFLARGARVVEAATIERRSIRLPSLLQTAGDDGLLLPVRLGERLIGVVAVGGRTTGVPLDRDDLDLLETLVDQSAVALHNAFAYHELAALRTDLDGEVVRQTRRLRVSNEEVARAVEELAEARDQLVETDKMASLGQLVAGVGHELATPAGFVQGSLVHLQMQMGRMMQAVRHFDEVPWSPPAAERWSELREEVHADHLLSRTPSLLRICGEGADRIRRLVDDLRIFSRYDRDRLEPLDLVKTLDAAVGSCRDRARASGVAIEFDAPSPLRLLGVSGLLVQAWKALLLNAIDAVGGRPGGFVCIQVRRNDDDGPVEVRFLDNGPGVPEEIRGKVVDPFFSTKPLGRGTGLGLSIVYGAIKAHGGSLEIRAREGGGTEALVELEVRRSPGGL